MNETFSASWPPAGILPASLVFVVSFWSSVRWPCVPELLPEWVLAQNAELTVEEVARSVHAHPTLSEVLMEVAHGATGGYIHI